MPYYQVICCRSSSWPPSYLIRPRFYICVVSTLTYHERRCVVQVAPITVKHITKLFQLGCYNSNHFFRVHAGFVAQTADVVGGRLVPLAEQQQKEAQVPTLQWYRPCTCCDIQSSYVVCRISFMVSKSFPRIAWEPCVMCDIVAFMPLVLSLPGLSPGRACHCLLVWKDYSSQRICFCWQG